MIVRTATGDDIVALTALYNDLGVATTASYDLHPALLDERRAWLAEHDTHGWPVLVADDDGPVIGFAAYGAFRAKPGYRFTAEHTVYVAPDHQGRGVGRALMSVLIEHARAAGLHAMVGVVDAENTNSIAFHESLGFQTVGAIPEVGRKFGRWLTSVYQVLILSKEDPDEDQ